MHDLTALPAFAGGALIGLAASLFLLTHGRVAGISGLFGGVFRRAVPDRPVRLAFVLGLLAGGIALRAFAPTLFASAWEPALPIVLVAGLFVGFGTQLGNGCTSGHGVCGISRFSRRSLAATGTFILAGMVTVYVVRHLAGGAS